MPSSIPGFACSPAATFARTRRRDDARQDHSTFCFGAKNTVNARFAGWRVQRYETPHSICGAVQQVRTRASKENPSEGQERILKLRSGNTAWSVPAKAGGC
jgi:hypothetical protein